MKESTSSTTKEDVTILRKYESVENPYGSDISPINFSYSSIGQSTLNVRIGPSGRFEPPISIPRAHVNTGESFVVEQSDQFGVFSFKVTRKSTGTMIWDTSIGGMLFADQYIQIAAFIGSSEIYGIGENTQQSLKHNLTIYSTWPMFARGQNPEAYYDPSTQFNAKNLYGAYPFYLALESDNKAHGVLIINSNPQEITLGPAPHIVYRTIGGMLDIYFFPGPSPEDVVKQYLALVGTPALPSYWSLGYQVFEWFLV
ncbi:unnamed protein product [Anisakis simplex]|uniref:NtCtMGAM_N domain-containing protein n=1 Tax=Anisakis simplex TaxID=6269 RepID=A0A0M3J1Q6_ANISI|nr:unnamed protein product [Anisakis simplex]